MFLLLIFVVVAIGIVVVVVVDSVVVTVAFVVTVAVVVVVAIIVVAAVIASFSSCGRRFVSLQQCVKRPEPKTTRVGFASESACVLDRALALLLWTLPILMPR